IQVFQLSRDQCHVSQGGPDCDPILEPRNAVEIMTASPLFTGAGSVKRSPELCRLGWREMKLRWQHSDNDIRKAVQRNRLPQNILFSAVPFLPGGVAQYDCAGRRW